MASTATKAVVGLLLALLLLVGGAIAYASYLMGGDPGGGEPVEVKVAEGETAATVGAKLHEKDVIRSALAFRLKARSAQLDRRLQAGVYELETGMSVDEAISRLLAAPIPEGMRFTVPEGLTVAATLERLAQQTPHTVDDYRRVLDSGELELPDWVPPLDSLGAEIQQPYEGLFFPETYELRSEATPARVLQRLVDQLENVVDAIPDEHVAAMADRGYTRYDVLIMASLVEREAQVDEERATVAGVILNRLQADRLLEVDASVAYALGKQGQRITFDDLEADSPYNTYENLGLPPTPIAAPGRAAIEAAFNPEEHDFLFYVRKDAEGRHAFAETFEEHQRNVARYRDFQRLQEVSPGPSPSPTG